MKKRSSSKIRRQKFIFFSFFAVLLLVGIMGVGAFALNKLASTDSRSQAMGVNSLTDAFVTRQGTSFMLGDKPFRFVGFNLFDAAGSGDSPYSCLEKNGWWTKFSDSELDAALKTMKRETGSTVLRFWAFQTYTKGGQDFTGIDKVIKLAKLNGFKVLPVLEDGPGYCTEPGGGGNAHMEKWKYQGDTWYTEGYKVTNAPYTLSYRDYVKTIVTRYKDEPAIMAWMLVNEADTSKKVPGPSGKQQSALVGFATDMGNLVKSIDKNHLVTVGTQSNGASGATGQDFIDVYSVSSIDFAEAHDWGYWGNDKEAIPGGTRNSDGSMKLPDPQSADCLKTYQAKIGCSLAQSIKVVGKPFVMGESGISANNDASRLQRSKLIDDKMKAFFDNGGAGYLYWQWNKIVDAQQYDVLPNTNDPLLPVIKKYAGLDIPALGSTATPSAIPTARPSAFPTTKPTALPTSKPSPKPSTPPNDFPRISPRPLPAPSPKVGATTLEGEKMTFVSGSGRVVKEASASAGQALFMETNGTVKGTIALGATKKIKFRLRPIKCASFTFPHVNIKFNGSYILDKNIDVNGYYDYEAKNLATLNLKPGNYPVEIIYNNDTSFRNCNQGVQIDSITSY